MTDRELPIPDDVLALCRRMRDHGHRTWVVGGCLRDMLLERPLDDWDLATSARPEEVKKVFRKVIPTGIAHGTVTVLFRGQSYELTTLRGEGAYSDGRRPDSVHFVDDIEADLARRDFTVNAIAYDPFERTLTDPFDGLEDLRKGVLRAVRDPRERFEEDGLRVLRAARFAATLQMAIEPATEAAIAPTLDTFRRVSAERVRDEWMKALKSGQPSLAFQVMRRTGILSVTLGDLLTPYEEAPWQSALCAVDTPLERLDPIGRLAGLLAPLAHRTAEVDGWLRDYRYSNAERARVLRSLEALTQPFDRDRLDVALRTYAAQVGRENALPCLRFRARWAECRQGDTSEHARDAHGLVTRAEALITDAVALSVRELAISGKQVIGEAGVPPGPQVGRLLSTLLEEVLEDPTRNQAQWLLERARQLRDA